MRELISVVIPMYYEEAVAKECYSRLKKAMHENDIEYEFIFVNDGSTDKTMEILTDIAIRDQQVKVISFSRNFGHQNAVTAGIDYAVGDALVIIDADLQDPPELIPELVAKWKSGYEVVYAKRKQRKGETFFKLITAKFYYCFLNAMTDISIPKDTGDFRIIDRKVAETLKKMPERNRFIRGMVSWAGFKQTCIEYDRDERFAGETKYPLKKMIKFAFDGIFSFSSKPLRIINTMGIIAVFISIIVLFYSLFVKLTGISDVQVGWTSLMAAVTFFGGVQMLGLGIIGQYIARIYDESKDRPIYIVSKTLNFEKNELQEKKEEVFIMSK